MPLYEYELCEGSCAICGGRFTLRHHMPIVGYNENNDTVLVQDPWTKPFWISVYRLADMAGTRGYVSLK